MELLIKQKGTVLVAELLSKTMLEDKKINQKAGFWVSDTSEAATTKSLCIKNSEITAYQIQSYKHVPL